MADGQQILLSVAGKNEKVVGDHGENSFAGLL